SLRLTPGGTAGSVRVEQRLAAGAWTARADAPDTRRLRLAGFVYAPAAGRDDASLWLRVTGGGGNLFADSSADARADSSADARADSSADSTADSSAASAAAAGGAAAAAEWRRVEVELPLPADAAD